MHKRYIHIFDLIYNVLWNILCNGIEEGKPSKSISLHWIWICVSWPQKLRNEWVWLPYNYGISNSDPHSDLVNMHRWSSWGTRNSGHTHRIARHASVFIMDDNVKRTYYMIHEKRRCTPWNENIDLSTYFFWGTSMITNMKYFVQGLDKILLIQLL